MKSDNTKRIMMINVLRCPRNVGVVANNKQLNASSNRCSGTSRTIKNNTKNSRRRKGVVISSFGEAYNLSFFYLFVFLLLRPSSSSSLLGKEKKRLNSLLSSSSSSSSPRRRCFFARARKRRLRVLLYRIVIVRDLGSISEEFCARAREREIFFSHTERENKKKPAEGRGENFFLLSFFSFALFCTNQREALKIHRVSQKVWL